MAKEIKETKENLKEFNLVTPAKELLEAMIASTDATSHKKMTPDRYKNMKLTLGFFNAYKASFQAKVGYFKMKGVGEKVNVIKSIFGKRK